jgi:hypothetical protein
MQSLDLAAERYPSDKFIRVWTYDNSTIHRCKGDSPCAADMNRGWGGAQRKMSSIVLSKKVGTRNAGERIDLVFSGEAEEMKTICPDLIWGGMANCAKDVTVPAARKGQAKGMMQALYLCFGCLRHSLILSLFWYVLCVGLVRTGFVQEVTQEQGAYAGRAGEVHRTC